MTEIPTRRLFAEQLADVTTDVRRLGDLVCAAVPAATTALLESDLDGARRLIDGDAVINDATADIEAHCFQLLVLESPMAGDLRIVITALRLATEIERCGDLACNIAKAARRLYYVELDPKLRGMIERMSDLAVRLLRFALDAYADSDEARAAALDDLDDELDNLHRAFIEAIFESHSARTIDLRIGVQLALVGRFYERLGDHAVNIGERVQYQVTGEVPAQSSPPRSHEPLTAVPEAPARRVVATTDRGIAVADEAQRNQVEAIRRDFVANIGHELRTPVGALAVLAETLRTEVAELDGIDESSTVIRLSDRLTYEAGRLGRTIDDLLELSRIEAGELPEPREVTVGEILDAALERTIAAVEVCGVNVHTDVPDADAAFTGDRRQLVSALANLIDNAAKYSEEGGTIHVSGKADADFVRFEIADQGIGIPTNDQSRIFERFYRVDRARRRDTGGTGLGLAIVRHVVINHGGSIEVTSFEGEGSTFTLSIPRAPAPLLEIVADSPPNRPRHAT